MQRPLLISASILVILMTAPLGTAQEVPRGSGPLVGHTTGDSATIWVYAPSDWTIRATSQEKAGEGNGGEFEVVADPIGKLGGVPHKLILKDLKPNTKYDYVVTADDKLIGNCSFKTSPADGEAARFRVAVTSCMKIGQPQESWNLMLADKPDFHVTLGDTTYGDSTDPTVQWSHHLRYRAQPEFAKVIRSMPNYAIWDDHDYGPNNSDGTAKGKEKALEGWKQFWGNPESGTKDTAGAFFKFSWGDVDFFIVDGRYHRSPDKSADDGEKRMLGDAQFAWLLDGLKNSEAKFKVIASGSTLHDSTSDGWRIYTFSRHRLFDALKENKISGVLYCSGDVHRSHVWTHHESERVGYPLIEVVSSGIANSKTLSYATIDFDTTKEDPEVKVRIVHGDDKVHDEKVWKLSELTVKSPEDQQ